jgi:hypothetical protein
MQIVQASHRRGRRLLPLLRRAAEPSVPWYYQPVWIILLTFTVLGPFGLPLIWKTPKMSRGLKIALASITLAFTVVLVYAAYWVMAFLFQYYGQLNEQLNQMSY